MRTRCKCNNKCFSTRAVAIYDIHSNKVSPIVFHKLEIKFKDNGWIKTIICTTNVSSESEEMIYKKVKVHKL
jgi:hypothetical protein